MPTQRNATPKRKAANEPVPAPVSTPYTVEEVARVLDMSISWVVLNARRLGAHKGRGRGHPWRFARERIEQELRDRASKTSARADRGPVLPNDLGIRAALVFERFEAGDPFHKIVVDLHEPPKFIEEMHTAWLAGIESDRRRLTSRCACGCATDPRTAKCLKCAARSRTLADAEIAQLAGTPLGEHDVLCSGCAKPTPAEGSRHVCPSCEDKISVGVVDGRFAIAVGSRVVRVLSADETKGLLAPFTHAADEPPPSANEAVAEIVEAPRPTPRGAPRAKPKKPDVTSELNSNPIDAIDSIIEGWDEDFEAMKDAIATGDPDAVMNLTQEQRMKILKRKTRT